MQPFYCKIPQLCAIPLWKGYIYILLFFSSICMLYYADLTRISLVPFIYIQKRYMIHRWQTMSRVIRYFTVIVFFYSFCCYFGYQPHSHWPTSHIDIVPVYRHHHLLSAVWQKREKHRNYLHVLSRHTCWFWSENVHFLFKINR